MAQELPRSFKCKSADRSLFTMSISCLSAVQETNKEIKKKKKPEPKFNCLCVVPFIIYFLYCYNSLYKHDKKNRGGNLMLVLASYMIKALSSSSSLAFFPPTKNSEKFVWRCTNTWYAFVELHHLNIASIDDLLTHILIFFWSLWISFNGVWDCFIKHSGFLTSGWFNHVGIFSGIFS